MRLFRRMFFLLVCVVAVSAGHVSQALQSSMDLLATPACAQTTEKTVQPKGLAGRELYDEAIAVSKLLRDPSSANNTLFESETALSGELKALIYQKLREGATRGEILDYMAERYGEAVRYQPDFNATTFLLWASPWIAVVAGSFVFWRSTRRRKKPAKGS